MTPEDPGFERIVPKAPAAGDGARAMPAAAKRGATISSTTFLAGIGILGILAVLAFIALPQLVGPPSPHAPGSESHPPAPRAAAPPASTPPPDAAAPAEPAKPIWDDAAALQARADAQDAKAHFEETVNTLSGHAIDRWAADELAAAQAHADAGAKTFAAKDFAAANQEYQAAAAGADALVARMPQVVAKAVQDGLDALTRGDRTAAATAFDLATAIAPDDKAAIRGTARVASFDAVRTKVDAGAALERADDLPAAAAAYQEALKLDADDPAAREGLARTQGALADREFRRVLADGVAALDRGDLAAADARLARARALRSGDPGVQQASARLAEARRTGAISGLQSKAASQVAAEDWAGAVTTYEAALAQDPNLAFAIDGLAQARGRADLARRLQTLVDDPARLYSSGVKADAEAWLEEARAIPNPGPVLKRQATAVAQGLAAAAMPVHVTIRSDGLTDITVYRIGALGKFPSHDLDLKPGRYTAIGTRAGYRDVRKDFDVAPGGGTVVEVRCEETI